MTAVTDPPLYGTSTKDRWTAAKDAEVRAAIVEVLAEDHPASVRGVYYRVLSRGLFAKGQRNYRKVQRRVLDMRRSGGLNYEWVTDGTRLRRKPATYADLDDALWNTLRTYRRQLWADQDVHVEIWSEKDAITGILYEVTAEWDVPLPISRGFSSESFLYRSGAEIAEIGKPTHIYYFSDLDHSGVALTEHVQAVLPRFAPGVPITFTRAAVTEEQVHDLGLITREPSARDRRHGWRWCVEIDAIPSSVLRGIARDCIERHVDPDRLAVTRRVEAIERGDLEQLIQAFSGHDGGGA